MYINEQRSENLKMQLEATELVKTKNKLNQDIVAQVARLRRLERFLGVERSNKFDQDFKDNFYENLEK